MHNVEKWLNILKKFESISSYFSTLCMKGVNWSCNIYITLHVLSVRYFSKKAVIHFLGQGCIRFVSTWNKRKVNPLSANPTKWSNTLKQFVGNSRRIVWVCLTILWGWRFKSYWSDTVSFKIPIIKWYISGILNKIIKRY